MFFNFNTFFYQFNMCLTLISFRNLIFLNFYVKKKTFSFMKLGVNYIYILNVIVLNFALITRKAHGVS